MSAVALALANIVAEARDRRTFSPVRILKSDPERRYTVGVALPARYVDLQGDWAEADDLLDASIAFVRRTSNDRTVFIDHGRTPAGEWTQVMSLPFDCEANLASPGEKARVVKLRKGTVLLGVVWSPETWRDHVKTGRLRGLSVGGRATRRPQRLEK